MKFDDKLGVVKIIRFWSQSKIIEGRLFPTDAIISTDFWGNWKTPSNIRSGIVPGFVIRRMSWSATSNDTGFGQSLSLFKNGQNCEKIEIFGQFSI